MNGVLDEDLAKVGTA